MEYKWGELISLEYGKPIKDKEKTDGQYPVYGTNGQIGTSDLPPLCNHASFILGRKGAYRGVHYSSVPFSVIDTAFYAENLHPELLNIEWAYYKFLTYDINSMDSGSAIPSTDRYEIYAIEVDLPNYKSQKKTVELLRSLDEKIELNNKINENLQQQAQAIYQEWFGDINTEKEQGTLSNICTYSKERVSVSELDISTYFSTENMLPGKAGAVEASSLPTTAQTTACHVGDTLISNIRPYFKKIVYCHEECGCSTDVLCFVPVHPKYSAYLYSTLYADRFFDFMVAGSKGTKMPRGDKQQIMTYPVALPTETELERFNSVAVPILMQIQNNRNENKRLALIRNTLLPKLMSGEINLGSVGE